MSALAAVITAHPFAEICPLLGEADLTALAVDIRDHGLQQPITLHNGRILDGRNRYRACLLAGVEPTYTEFSGTEADALDLVVSLNVHRRHLSESQRALIGARLATLRKGANQHASIEAPSQAEAAELLNVSRASVQRAREVLDSGDAELVAAVDQGELAVSAAVNIARGMPAGTFKGYNPRDTSVEWYTPTAYVDAARDVLGAIDLDPASCAEANERVRAERFYSRDDDGLTQAWRGRVWMNPPYGEHTPRFVAKLIEEHDAGRVTSAVVLLNSFCVTTKYFQPLWDHTLCFARERIGFYKPGGDQSKQAINGTVFVYLGPQPERFAGVFAAVGPVVRQWPRSEAA